MKTKQQKGEELKMLKETLPKSSITIFTTFARQGEPGLSVSQVQELKRSLRQSNSQYLTAKKSLVEIALRELKYDGIDVYAMNGSIGMVVGTEDAYGVAKKLYEFAKKNQSLQFFGALVDGVFVDKAHIIEMAVMPSREVLLGRLFGMMKYPIASLAMVLGQIAKQKESNTPAAPVEPAPSEPVAPVEAVVAPAN